MDLNSCPAMVLPADQDTLTLVGTRNVTEAAFFWPVINILLGQDFAL